MSVRCAPFRVDESTSGNTGAVEIEVYGDPAGRTVSRLAVKHAALTMRRVFAGVLLLGLMGACTAGDRLGTAWGEGSFDSNGERIYFTGTSERDGYIGYTGGVDTGGMMMGGRLSCASCHGPDARGGTHVMHMEVMDAPNVRWVALLGHGDGHDEEEGGPHGDDAGFDLETFRMAVVEGRHPDGQPLSEEMPRWEMSGEDLADLAEYLQSFTDP